MEIRANQIHNLLRTYGQMEKLKPYQAREIEDVNETTSFSGDVTRSGESFEGEKTQAEP